MLKATRATLALALILASVALCLPGWLQAMEIQKFDRMTPSDQEDYIQLLVDGAQKVLIDEGKRDLAARQAHLSSSLEIYPATQPPWGSTGLASRRSR